MGVTQNTGGILIAGSEPDVLRCRFCELAKRLGIDHLVQEDAGVHAIRLHAPLLNEYFPDFDTLQMDEGLRLPPLSGATCLEREILLSMLLGPVTFSYPSYAEFSASIQVRINIVEAARRTALAFHTSKIERPAEYWTYSEENGFTTAPGKPLIEALRQSTQPAVSGREYSFSCYRATEYVILLGIAEELARTNPPLLHQLEAQWARRAIMSRQFHEIFMCEYGSLNEPLPHKYYVPGDRLWFRNPDECSSDVSGYEGSWVMYLGGGLFTNFWQCGKPYTLTSKCIELYHWRHGVYQDADGNLRMDEAVVERRALSTLNDPDETERILEQMLCLRDAPGIYENGGCIDASREYPRCICPGTADLILPDDPFA